MIKEFLQKQLDKIRNRPVEVYGDMETRDNYLRSLRRERRIQLEQEEKVRLKAQIDAYNKRKRAENLYGMGKNILRTPNKFSKKRIHSNNSRWL